MNNAPETHATNRTHHIIIALGLAAFLVGIAAPAGLLVWEAMSPMVIMREGAAGTLLSTHVHPGAWFAATLTRVDTSTGNVMAQGPFSGTEPAT